MRGPARTALIAAALAGIALVATVLDAVARDKVSFRSLDEATTLVAHLDRPSGDEPRPAVVLLHGCSGLAGANGRIFAIYHAWMRTLVDAGYVALAVDSAGSRGFGQTCTAGPQRRTMYRDRPKDAYAALRFLQAQSFVDPKRIAVMGWSQGGAIVLLSVVEPSIGRPQALSHDFVAAVALYPGACDDRYQSRPFTKLAPHSWSSRIPLLVLFGEADNWTPFAPCRDFIEEARGRGSPLELKSYPNALHGFDAPNTDRLELPAYRMENGVVPEVGTSDAARADALLRALAFLKQRLER